jgi:DnaD/phage-associated family protein
MNTVRGRNAVQAIEAGRFEIGGRDVPIALIVERPNIFSLYEQNIGPLTPMIGDQLQEAERDYPAEWIEEAIQQAVKRNKRSWRYIEAILKRWQAEGKNDGLAKQPTQADRYRYIQGELSDYINY